MSECSVSDTSAVVLLAKATKATNNNSHFTVTYSS